MLKSNIVENEDSAIHDFQKLLDDPAKQKLIELSLKMAPRNKNAVLQDKLGVKIKKDKISNSYNTKLVFTLSEIKKECIRYGLTFIKIKNFTGELSTKLLTDVQNFITNNNLGISDYDLGNCIYMLIPAVNNSSMITECKSGIVDPLILYRDGDTFIVISGNKNYVNLSNLWTGFKNYSIKNLHWAYIIENYVIGMILLFILNKIMTLTHNVTYMIVLLLPSIIASLIRFEIRKSKSDFSSNYYKCFNKHKLTEISY